MLAVGAAPRACALALGTSLVPTTLGGHAYWTVDDRALRSRQRTQLLKNAAILAGLVLSARRV
jgi:uncharacterized membrane protein YphA (DoxX/SURF4 family)